MRKILRTILFSLLACLPAAATTYNIPSGYTAAQVQTVVSGASAGDTVVFPAATLTFSAAVTLKCGVTYTGPVANPATAEITTTANIRLFQMSGGCASNTTTTIEYLHLNFGGPLYLDQSNYSNILFLHNQITSLQAETSCGGACQSLYLDGSNNNTYTNITVEYNTFGDTNSCTAGISIDDGGCAGILVSPAMVTNFVAKYNTFNHVLEGIHFNDVNYVVGNKTAQCDGCDIELNYFNNIHRIGIEFQTNVINHQAILSNNVFGNPLNAYYNTLTLSAPCCQYSNTFGTPSNVVPSNQITNNVEINSLATSSASPYAVEMAGNGTNANNNLIQGSFCKGFVWSFGASNWTVSNNTIQGPLMSGASCPTSSIGGGAYISAESGGTYAPIQVGNVTGTTPSALPSVSPTISPATGAATFPLTVTLTDPGYTTGSQPLGNTGIWYTTDGSSPVPGSGTATYLPTGGTFSLGAAGTVKAVGMWGAPPQPTSYASGYGFFPSTVVSATYTGGAPPAPTLVSTSLSTTPTNGINSANVGGTIQFQTIGNYSDGSSANVTATSFDIRSGGSFCSVTNSGLMTAVAAGSCNVESVTSGITSSYWTVTVTSSVTLSSITITGASSVVARSSIPLSASGTYSNGSSSSVTPTNWTSNAPQFCTVSSAGVVTGVAAGTCAITAYVGTLASGTFPVTVAAPSTLTGIIASPSVFVTASPQLLGVASLFSDGTSAPTSGAVWASSNTSVATVDQNGNVTPAGPQGSSLITATLGGFSTSSLVIVPATATYPFPNNNILWNFLYPRAPGTYTLVINSDNTITITH
jgi:hypothetical protein